MPEIQSKTNVAVHKPMAIMLSLQEAQWEKLHGCAQNLSNASTAGFKALTVRTEEVIYKTSDNKPVSYVKVAGVVRDTSDGPVKPTGNPLDIALVGRGYFGIQTPAGTRYTRNGQFRLDETGKLVNAQNYPVLDNTSSEIFIPANVKRLHIAEDGTFSSNGVPLGKIMLADFADEQQLVEEGYGLYRSSVDADPATNVRVMQGAIEDSNVSPMQESIRLMEILRLYENAQKVIDEYDQLQRKVLNASPRNS